VAGFAREASVAAREVAVWCPARECGSSGLGAARERGSRSGGKLPNNGE